MNLFTIEEHLDNLIRHIRLVQEATVILGKKEIANGRASFAMKLIARGFEHDNTKFYGYEDLFLHRGNDSPKEQTMSAAMHHALSNDHHPEYWDGVENMPEIAVAEMVCDWYARSQSFGTSLREWINKTAINRFKINNKSQQWEWIQKFVDILLEDSFIK